MLSLQLPHLSFLPKPLLKPLPKPLSKPLPKHLSKPLPKRLPKRQSKLSVSGLSSDEFPVDETFLESFGPKEKETEDEARRKNWVDRGWAPWEEILSPEADFAKKSLNEGEEVPLQTPEALEAFKMLSPKYRLVPKKSLNEGESVPLQTPEAEAVEVFKMLSPKYRKQKMEEMGLTEDDYYAKQFEMKGEIPDPLETKWGGPLVVRHVPPRDWPPPGWEVDKDELEFIRGAHKLQAVRVDIEELEGGVSENTDDLCLDRYKVFLKQYNEWVEANKDRLEEESYKYDQDYYPGRRKRGKDYKEGMYELPFYYPGQVCLGKVTTLHLYQGAFLDIGGVHDGWVPIKRNDWYWIRHHIKVGMHVIVEILAKRDPYRFRFPIEMRFVDPNIDHLVFNRFDFPPIFHRDEDTNPDEVLLDSGRPPMPRKDPGTKVEEETLLSNHPYVDKLWQIHNAEQMILDDLEANPEKYDGKKLSDLTDDEDLDDENIEYTEVRFKKSLVPKMIVRQSVKELDLEAALAERQHHNRLRAEAKERGEGYKITKLKRNTEMDEYDLVHWRRSIEEREALMRDISCRQALGLPLVEPGRYLDASFFKDQYDPSNNLYKYDYWGEPKNSEKSRKERMRDAHNKSIIGNGIPWYGMSYEEAIKQQKERKEAQLKDGKKVEEKQVDYEDEVDDSDDDDDFDYSILGDPSVSFSGQPVVNGTESSSMSDEGMFED